MYPNPIGNFIMKSEMTGIAKSRNLMAVLARRIAFALEPFWVGIAKTRRN